MKSISLFALGVYIAREVAGIDLNAPPSWREKPRVYWSRMTNHEHPLSIKLFNGSYCSKLQNIKYFILKNNPLRWADLIKVCITCSIWCAKRDVCWNSRILLSVDMAASLQMFTSVRQPYLWSCWCCCFSKWWFSNEAVKLYLL